MPSAGAHELWKQADTHTHLRDFVNLEIVCVFILETLRIVFWVRCWMGVYFLNLHSPSSHWFVSLFTAWWLPSWDLSLPLSYTVAAVDMLSKCHTLLRGVWTIGRWVWELGARPQGLWASWRCGEDDAFPLWLQKRRMIVGGSGRIRKWDEDTDERWRHC